MLSRKLPSQATVFMTKTFAALAVSLLQKVSELLKELKLEEPRVELKLKVQTLVINLLTCN